MAIELKDADLPTRVTHTFSRVAEELKLSDKVSMKGEPGVGRWFVRLGSRAVLLSIAEAASMKKIEEDFRWAFGVLTAK